MDLKKYILEFKTNNLTQFKDFYNLTHKAIYLTALAILKNSDDALDIVQDTYLNFLKNINNIDTLKFHEGYLLKISRNLSINHYKQRQKVFSSQELIDIQKDNTDMYNDLNVKAILDKLDDNLSREIVVYHVLLDYKFKDIAKIIDKPLGTTLWLYNKAIKVLKERVVL